jgi:MerR HTH family regulatory protein
MKPTDYEGDSESLSIGRLAALLGLSTENIRALEKRGRLPEGCEPAIDEITGTRYWTRDQAERLKEWNDRRSNRPGVEQPQGRPAVLSAYCESAFVPVPAADTWDIPTTGRGF